MYVARPRGLAPAKAPALPRRWWGWAVGLGALAATGLLPREGAWLAALGAIIVFGVPHGALDGEIARPLVRRWVGRRWGWAWFLVFAVPYLALAGAVLVVWRLAPEVALAGFLAGSVWHFGEEDAGGEGWLAAVVRGGLPIGLPVLVHPGLTAGVLGVVAGVGFAGVPGWLWGGSLVWGVLAVVWGVRRGVVPGEVVAVGVGFLVLPPLTAFAVYFVGVHAPRHMAALAGNPVRAPRVRSVAEGVWRAVPVTVLTVAIGAALWPVYGGGVAPRLLMLTLQGLSALTLPHMVLERVAGWVEGLEPDPCR